MVSEAGLLPHAHEDIEDWRDRMRRSDNANRWVSQSCHKMQFNFSVRHAARKTTLSCTPLRCSRQIRRRAAHPGWQHHTSEAGQRQERGARQIIGIFVCIAHTLNRSEERPMHQNLRFVLNKIHRTLRAFSLVWSDKTFVSLHPHRILQSNPTVVTFPVCRAVEVYSGVMCSKLSGLAENDLLRILARLVAKNEHLLPTKNNAINLTECPKSFLRTCIFTTAGGEAHPLAMCGVGLAKI